jgi:predicted O-methyltransferase YrrM
MANRTINMSEALHAYLLDVSVREHPAMTALRQETYKLEAREMQMAPEQAQFMGLLAKLTNAQRALEIGVFTGYSALAVALAMPEHGKLVACDVSHTWTSIGRPYWEQAGVAHKIDLRIAPALETLEHLLQDPDQHNLYDLAFIDADKGNYPHYYEICLKLVRPGGLIVIDNVLWGGGVIDPSDQGESVKAIRKLNADIYADERVDLSLVPIGDGMTLARRR